MTDEAVRVFVPGHIPTALQPLFDVSYTPSSLVRYDPEAWELPEIQRAINTLRRLRTTPDSEWRLWADRELEAVFAAVRGSPARGQNLGKELDRELLEEFERLERAFEEHTPVGIGRPVNETKYKLAPVLMTPGPSASPTGASYAILAELYGLSEANVRQKISRARARDPEKVRRRSGERTGPAAPPKKRKRK